MEEIDPFEGLGKALAELRKRAGFATQLLAAERLGLDKGQLSRWENDRSRPGLENLGRLLAGYGATVMDLGALLCEEKAAEPKAEDRGPTDEELIRALADAIRRVEGRQVAVEGRQTAAEGRLLRLEEELAG